LLKNKKVYTCGYNFYGQLGNGSTTSSYIFNIISNNIKVKEISCGTTHTSILSLDGKVYTCGNNTHNQLGKITPTIQNPEFTIINTAFIRNIKLSSLSSGCGSNLVFVLY
jgi:alpha-tubulin suppressor-like RCC1 family protein